MSFKFLCVSVLGLILSLPMLAQVEDESLGDLSAWGQRYLSSQEEEFAPDLWQGSDTKQLLEQLQDLRVSQLSPAGRELLRRVILSPAEAPDGEDSDELLAERAKWMMQLGEARAAAALAPRLESEIQNLDTETLAIDLDLAAGREASACAALAGPPRTEPYWLKLRAVCAVLSENYTEAELAIEVASAQDVNDPWLVEVIFAASGDLPNRPNARYDTGLNIALSTKTDLDTSRITLAGSRPDLAAAAAQRPGVPIDLKARFVQMAATRDLISSTKRRALLREHLSQPDYLPANNLEQTLAVVTASDSTLQDKARRLAQAFRAQSRADFSTYRHMAELFLPDLKRLRTNAESAEFALDFARASLAAGDNSQARRWLASLNITGAPEVDAFAWAKLEALAEMTRSDPSPALQSGVLERLIVSAESQSQKEQVADTLSLWMALNLNLSPAAREALNALSDEDRRLSPGALMHLQAAAQQGLIAETALSVLVALQTGKGTLSKSDMTALVRALRQIGVPDLATAFALESTAFWRD